MSLGLHLRFGLVWDRSLWNFALGTTGMKRRVSNIPNNDRETRTLFDARHTLSVSLLGGWNLRFKESGILGPPCKGPVLIHSLTG